MVINQSEQIIKTFRQRLKLLISEFDTVIQKLNFDAAEGQEKDETGTEAN